MNKNNNKYDFPNLNVYLNDDEVDELDRLSDIANKTNNSIRDNNDPMTMNIKTLIRIWAIKNLEIFTELVLFFSSVPEKYSIYFQDIDDTKQWFVGIAKFIKDFYYILIKNQRSIYFGITLIILSFMLYIINVTD